MGLVVVVKTVSTKKADEGRTLHLLLRYICQVYSRRVTLEFHVQPELCLLDVGGEIVHILHHQAPVPLLRVVGCILH